MSNTPIVGWDVGGAHLKAALLDNEGTLQQVIQVPCALWRGLSELESAIDVVLVKLGISTALHAITMTGELVDLFTNRQSGVNEISRLMNAKLQGVKQFYTGALNPDFSGFVVIDEVEANWQHIASANWLASATYAAQQVKHGLLIDIGSTTTDFMLIEQHLPKCLGLTDAARMQTEELVYAGVIRTPLMAVTQKIEFQSIQTSVAAEYFATTADVYRLTGDLHAEDDMADAADGKEKTSVASVQRIARMIGHDANDAPHSDWLDLALSFKELQLVRLQQVAEKHVARFESVIEPSLISAGAGSFLVCEVAKRMNLPYLEVSDLLNESKANIETKHWANVCLPAYAVAYLAFNDKNNHSI